MYPFGTLAAAVKIFDLNLLFNGCGACSTATNVLISFVEQTELVPVAYLPTNSNNIGDNTTVNYNMECLAKGATFAGQTVTITADNCAKAIGRVAGGATTYHCIQCKPGFYPTRDANDSAKITACTAFANC